MNILTSKPEDPSQEMTGSAISETKRPALPYREVDAIHYSLLAALDKDPLLAKDMLEGKEKKAPALSLGSLVDDALLGNTDGTTYRIVKQAEPSDRMGEFAQEFIRLRSLGMQDGFTAEWRNDILAARKNIEYNMNYKDDTIVEKFKKEAQAYCEEALDAIRDNCVPITEQVQEQVIMMVNALRTSKFTKDYLEDSASHTIHRKVPCYFTYNLQACKAEIDVVRNDLVSRHLEACDVKTCYSIYEFPKNVAKYRYDLQAALYLKGLKAVSLHKESVFHNIPVIENRFVFLVVDHLGRTMSYALESPQLSYAYAGGISVRGHCIQGLNELVTAITWHKTSGVWDHTHRQERYGYEALQVYRTT